MPPVVPFSRGGRTVGRTAGQTDWRPDGLTVTRSDGHTVRRSHGQTADIIPSGRPYESVGGPLDFDRAAGVALR